MLQAYFVHLNEPLQLRVLKRVIESLRISLKLQPSEA